MDDGLAGFQEGPEQVLIVSDGDRGRTGQLFLRVENIQDFLVAQGAVLIFLPVQVDLEGDGADVFLPEDVLRDVRGHFRGDLDVVHIGETSLGDLLKGRPGSRPDSGRTRRSRCG